MARPRSEDKRSAIVSAATRVIASQGLGAPTATIAKEAGVSNGSLFTYFETKAALFNHLYVELKAEMAAAALSGLPSESDLREQLLHLWTQLAALGGVLPRKAPRARAPGVSDDITPRSHQAGQTIDGRHRRRFWNEAVKTDRCVTSDWTSSSP